MTTYAQLTAEQRQDMINKLADLAVEMDLDVKVETMRELVCAIKAGEVSERMGLRITKEFPSEMKAKVTEFKEKADAIIGVTKGASIEVACSVGAGDGYETITKVKKMCEDAETDITHKEGEVLLIDFWATWCPPCQAPMQHNVDMLAKKKPEWENTVRIIGLSIDKDMETLKGHVDAKQWGSLEHYWRNESNCSDVYSVKGVPCVMLVDKQGKIIYKGHPAKRNLEEDLDNLAAGKVLEGEGIVYEKPTGEEKKQKQQDEDLVELKDLDKIHAEISSFRPTLEAFKNDKELMEKSKDMPRAFCVLVCTTEMDVKTKKVMGNYDNYRVLVGKKESIDFVKTKIEENVKSDLFKVQLQEHVI